MRTLALASSVLVTAVVISGGWTHLVRQRTIRLIATARVVTQALPRRNACAVRPILRRSAI